MPDDTPMRLPLSSLEQGEAAVIEEVALAESDRRFLMRFGLFAGAEVKCLRRAPLGDPIVYALDGSEVALRAETACQIVVSRREPRAMSGIA